MFDGQLFGKKYLGGAAAPPYRKLTGTANRTLSVRFIWREGVILAG